MEAIKNTQLTESDFSMILEALENLPQKYLPGEMMGMLLEGIISDGPEKEKYKLERKNRQKENQIKADQQKENVRLLQGKVIMLKRFFIENRLMSEVDDLITNKE